MKKVADLTKCGIQAVAAIVFLYVALLPIWQDRATAQTQRSTLGYDCLVADPTGTPLNVRASPRGPIVTSVGRGQSVFVHHWFTLQDERGKNWSEIYGIAPGGLQKLGVAFRDYLDCSQRSKSEGFPLVFESVGPLRQLGVDFPSFTERDLRASYFKNVCFYSGDGVPSMALSDEFVSRLRQRDISLEVACTVMRSGIVRFDPETGRRLATFIMVNRSLMNEGSQYYGLAVSEENPLEVPDCFARARFVHSRDTAYLAQLSPTGCQMRYHVWSGRRLTDAEAQVMSAADLVISGESAPDPSPESVREATLRPTSSSDAELARVMRRLKGN